MLASQQVEREVCIGGVHWQQSTKPKDQGSHPSAVVLETWLVLFFPHCRYLKDHLDMDMYKTLVICNKYFWVLGSAVRIHVLGTHRSYIGLSEMCVFGGHGWCIGLYRMVGI